MKKRSKENQRILDEKILRAKQLKKAKLPARTNIAGIDQATLCGVAYQLEGSLEAKAELWNLTLKTNETNGMKWIRFESKLRDFLKEKKIKILAWELPAGRNQKPLLHSAKLVGIIEKVCEEMKIDSVEFSSSQVKKFATGKGNANKEMMIKAAKELWGYEGDDDNIADALNILMFLKTMI